MSKTVFTNAKFKMVKNLFQDCKLEYDCILPLRLVKKTLMDEYKVTFLLIDSKNCKFDFIQSDFAFFSYQNEQMCLVKKLNYLVSVRSYHITEIRSFELIENQKVVTRNSSNFGKILVGGLLFGGAGAVAGALDKGGRESNKRKTTYSVRLFLNEIQQSAVELKCESLNAAQQLLQNFLILEEKYKKEKEPLEKEEKEIDNSSKKENIRNDKVETLPNYYDQIMHLKGLLEDGTLTEDEFIKLKNKIIQN